MSGKGSNPLYGLEVVFKGRFRVFSYHSGFASEGLEGVIEGFIGS